MEKRQIAEVVRGIMGARYRYPTEADPRPNDVPREVDCQDLVRYIQKACFGRDVLPLTIPGYHIRDLVKYARDNPERLRWSVSPRPVHGGLVEMSYETHPHHVGVWLDIDKGGILHAYTGGVTFAPELALKAAGWRRFVYYEWTGD